MRSKKANGRKVKSFNFLKSIFMIALNFIFIALRGIGPVFCAIQAEKKNRSTGLWAIFGFVFPIIAMICIFSLSSVTKWNKEK